MQRILFVLCTSLLFASCQKSIQPLDKPASALSHVKRSLLDSLSADRYADLDWSRVTRISLPNATFTLYRIPFVSSSNDFVLLKIATDDRISGRIVHLEENEHYTTRNYRAAFNGSVRIRYLNGTNILASPIVQGYISAFHIRTNPMTREDTGDEPPSTPGPEYQELPEVIVVSHPSANGYNFYSYASLYSFFQSSGWSNYYSGGGSDPGGGGGGNSGGGWSGGNPGVPPCPGCAYPIVDEPVLVVDFENQYADPAIDLAKYLSCLPLCLMPAPLPP